MIMDERCRGCAALNDCLDACDYGSIMCTMKRLQSGQTKADRLQRRASLEAENAALREQLAGKDMEIKRYQQWVNDLQSGMYVNCVYCGHRYGPADKVPASMAEALKAHIEQCPKHPMSQLKADLARVTADRDAAIAYMRKISWCAGCINFSGLSGCKDSLLEVCGKYHDYYQFRGPQKPEQKDGQHDKL